MNVASEIVLPEDSTQASPLRSVSIPGPEGRLEGLLSEGREGAPLAALVCHPHPLGGGNLHNKVVYHAAKVLNGPDFGLRLPVLRFNFRGVGLSQGAHDGEAEQADVAAALDWLEARLGLPVVLVGFSFGAAMALRACHERGNIRALACLGLPTEAAGPEFLYPFLATYTTPKLFLSGDRDEFAPAAQLARLADASAEPKRLVLIPGADHFFTGQLEAMQAALGGWLKEQLV